MAMKISRIERVGDGLRVVLADGSTAVYGSVADLPGDVAGLLARMDAAGESQAQGGADAARSAYMQRLQQAHQQGGPPDPGADLTGEAAYRARLEAGWQQKPAKRREHPKRWKGA